jgi:hypothetical protein
MRPVKVDSFMEFNELFGLPVPGGEGGDVWREGNRTSPTYASYAARAWLKNGSPITVVRVLGEQNDQATTGAGEAGWQMTDTKSYGLFIAASGSDAEATGTLAAVFYLDSGNIKLTGKQTDVTSTAISGAAEMVCNGGDNFQFTAVVNNGSTDSTVSFNFDPSSDMYIRKAFNTNPTLLGSTIHADVKKTYFLGETFDRTLNDIVGAASATEGSAYGFIAALNGGADRKGSTHSAAEASSGWVISQDMAGAAAATFDPANNDKLFKIHAIDSGNWANSNLKVSISDIKASSNEDVDPYGSFTVEVRRAQDTDTKKQVLETFTNCNMNPNSPNYIAAQIGDRAVSWSDGDARFTESGDYANNSSYIRVEMSTAATAGGLDASILPFGFIGPDTYKGFTGGTNSGSLAGDDDLINTVITNGFGADNTVSSSHDMAISYKIDPPKMALRANTAGDNLSDPTDAYFGVETVRSSTTEFDKSYGDLARKLPAITQTTASFVFTLDDVKHTSGSGGVEKNGEYAAGTRAAGTSLTAGGNQFDTQAAGNGNSYQHVLNAGFDKFTMPLVGGCDGFNIIERDPLRNTGLTGTEYTNYAVNSLKRAINTVSDPEVVEFNLAAVPGITAKSITNHLVDTCEQRADALAIIDLEGGYETEYEYAAGAKNGTAKSTVSKAKTRGMNSSYACSYYPWVQSSDELGTGKVLWVPPSVAALGTFASNDKKSAPWFAPAGFTRGGLTDGAAGIPVIGVREHLTRKMRDSLYENNINPIAKFPAEGIVIFGQKTMQASSSALDRVNVRRMMLHVKKGISRIASTLVFDQNVETTWARFSGQAESFLTDVQSRLGLTEYKVVLDETTTTADLVDRNVMYAKVFLKPARSIEFIAIDFVIQKSGASFDD